MPPGTRTMSDKKQKKRASRRCTSPAPTHGKTKNKQRPLSVCVSASPPSPHPPHHPPVLPPRVYLYGHPPLRAYLSRIPHPRPKQNQQQQHQQQQQQLSCRTNGSPGGNWARGRSTTEFKTARPGGYPSAARIFYRPTTR